MSEALAIRLDGWLQMLKKATKRCASIVQDDNDSIIATSLPQRLFNKPKKCGQVKELHAFVSIRVRFMTLQTPLYHMQ